MKATELFYTGGPLFMSILTIWGIGMLVFTAQKVIHFFVQGKVTKNGLGLILLFGSLAIVTGFLGQAIGLIAAFDAIEAAGDISPSLSSRRIESKHDCSGVWNSHFYFITNSLGDFERNICSENRRVELAEEEVVDFLNSLFLSC